MQYDLRKPALSVCGALPVTGAVGMTPSDLAAAVCEAWETTRRELWRPLCCTYMFVAHHSQLIEQPCDHQRQG